MQRSFTDFNNNARSVSESLDAMNDWTATIRAPIIADPVVVRGREMFQTQCASCHGAVKWTKSRTSPIYRNNPTFAADPLDPPFFAGNSPPLDPKLVVAGPQIKQINGAEGVALLVFLDDIGI